MDRPASYLIDLAVFGLTSGACFECTRLITTDEPSIILGYSIGSGVYFTVASIGAADLFWRWRTVFWQLLQVLLRQLPSAKLRELSLEARRTLERLGVKAAWANRGREPHRLRPETEADLRVFKYKLEKARIPCPNIEDVYGWLELLPELTAILEEGTVKEARKVWPAVDSQRQT